MKAKLILLLLLAIFLGAGVQKAYAAPAIRIFKAATGEEGVSSFTVPKDAGKSSWPVYIALSEAPSKPVTITVSHEGAAVFYWTGSDDLTFDKDSWSRRRRLVLEYQGNAQPGAKGRITLTANNGVASREILFTVESGSSTGGGGAGGGGSGSSGSTGNSGTNLAEDINTNDLNGLGFANLSVDEAVAKVINALLLLVALGAFGSILYSGYQYITSGGDAAQAAKARKNIMWALLGIIFAIMSYATLIYVVGLTRDGLTKTPSVPTAPDNSKTSDPSAPDSSGIGLVVKDSSGNALSTILLDSVTTGIGYPLDLSLSTQPSDSVTVTLTKEGNLPITLDITKLTFTPEDWNTPKSFSVTYNGDGKAGDAAQIVIKTSSGARYVLRIELPLEAP